MPAKKKKRQLPEAFIANQEKMKAGDLGPKRRAKKNTRKSAGRKPRK
jgi:hypothetical protein